MGVRDSVEHLKFLKKNPETHILDPPTGTAKETK